jgi:hypothetical protein
MHASWQLIVIAFGLDTSLIMLDQILLLERKTLYTHHITIYLYIYTQCFAEKTSQVPLINKMGCLKM